MIGWNDHWTRTLATVETQPGALARIVEQHRDRVALHDGLAVFSATLHPSLHQQLQDAGEGLSVGDWIIVDRDNDPPLVMHMLPRACLLERGRGDGTRQRIVANVDCALLLMGLDGDYSPNRLERYLLLVRSAGVMPVVLLTKPDRCDDIEARCAEIQRIAGSSPVHTLDARQGDAAAALAPYLSPGQTLVMLGSSGVGKSTLMNALLGAAVQKTGATRAGDDTGRHTTTSRTLRVLPGGACLIDTPGVRELQLAGSEEVVDQHGFDEIRRLAEQCRFSDCQHESEPGCAVVAQLSPERLHNYHKLRRELALPQRSPLEVAARKQKDRVIHKEQRRFERDHDKRR
ncbi:MAG: ribosome small subunit-dependent GTPase A [Solimonas sp.]